MIKRNVHFLNQKIKTRKDNRNEERIKMNSGETASEQLNNEAKKLDESIKKELKNSKSKVRQKGSGKGLKELAFKCF